MLRKKTKKAFMAVVSVIFALSIGYFAVLPPTSAWFYQDLYDEDRQFIFGTLSLDQVYLGTADIDLPAATKLENEAVFGETRFEEALHIVEVDATNDGTLPARVYLKVTAAAENPAGLHYYFYFDDDDGATVKEKIANHIAITDNAADTYTALDAYNIGSGYAGGQGRYIVVPPNTATKILKIAFWADYNVVGSNLENTVNVTDHYTYNVNIELHAGQNSDGWFTR
ncbi:MAG: hypothetical protein GXZ02_10340 [Clostridiales bacterium]|nr:hypothetical protein [Clostridiales bacterium]